MAGVNFTIGVDNTKFIGGIKQAGGSVKDLSKQMQDAFGQKLKQVLSFTAIEEGIRRTAEWASEITRTSKALGITAEQLQTLQIIASKTGTAESAVTSMFENIQKSRDEAIKGNTDLMQSYAKLGITLEDLRTKTGGQLFSEVMAKLPGSGQIVNNKDNTLRQAIQSVTGTPENVVAGFKQGYEGSDQDLQTKAEEEVKNGNIASEADIKEMTSMWSEIVTSLHAAGVQLIPVVKILLAVVAPLADAIGGLAQGIGNIFTIITGILTGDTGKIEEGFVKLGGMLINIPFGIMKILAGVIDSLLAWVSKIPGMGKYKNAATDMVNTWFDPNEIYHIDKGSAKRGQGLGAAATIVASMGEGAVGTLTKGASRGLEGVPGLGGVSTKLSNVGEGMVNRAALKEAAIQAEKYVKAETDYFKKAGVEMQKDGTATAKGVKLKEHEIAALEEDFEKTTGRKLLSKTHNALKGEGLGTAGLLAGAGLGAGVSAAELEAAKNKGLLGKDIKPILPLKYDLGNLSSGGANVKIGGMFGAGENKLITLNTQMVTLLGQIQQNTKRLGSTGKQYEFPMVNPVRQAGGL